MPFNLMALGLLFSVLLGKWQQQHDAAGARWRRRRVVLASLVGWIEHRRREPSQPAHPQIVDSDADAARWSGPISSHRHLILSFNLLNWSFYLTLLFCCFIISLLIRRLWLIDSFDWVFGNRAVRIEQRMSWSEWLSARRMQWMRRQETHKRRPWRPLQEKQEPGRQRHLQCPRLRPFRRRCHLRYRRCRPRDRHPATGSSDSVMSMKRAAFQSRLGTITW